MKKSIKVEKDYRHPIGRVWDAITKPEALSSWFVPGSFKAEVGFEYLFENEFTKVEGKVLQVEPPSLLVYSWIKNDTGIETEVHWKLESMDEGTKLVIEHFGIEKYERSAPALLQSNVEGWNYVIMAIENYLNS